MRRADEVAVALADPARAVRTAINKNPAPPTSPNAAGSPAAFL
jgi:hypothetical protein